MQTTRAKRRQPSTPSVDDATAQLETSRAVVSTRETKMPVPHAASDQVPDAVLDYINRNRLYRASP